MVADINESAAADISRGIVRVFASALGRGPAEARTTISGNVVVVVLEDTLTSSERALVDRDQAAAVTEQRRRLQAEMRDDMVAVVEGTLSRRVVSALGDHDAQRGISVQVFVTETLK